MSLIFSLLGALCVAAGVAVAVAIDVVAGVVIGLAGIGWFGVAGLSHVVAAIRHEGKNLDAVVRALVAKLDAVNETAEQIRLHAEVIRKAKEIEHAKAKQAAKR